MKGRRVDIKKTILKRIEDRHKQYVFIERRKEKKTNIPMNDRDNLRIFGKSKLQLNFKNFLVPYNKKLIVDYDAVIIIASYNRYNKLIRILNQLHKQETKYKIKIIIYDDGSTDINYDNLQKNFPEIDYIYNEINNGKYKYWETITTLFKKTSEYISHVVIQIDDDFILCNNFIDKLIDKFFEAKVINNKNVAIHYHISINDKRNWEMRNGIDGGTLFDTSFLKEIKYLIDPISLNRWKLNSELSSGVWTQISEKIHKNELLTYKLEHSLVEHDGNEDSKMHPKLRITDKIFSKIFRNDSRNSI